MAPRVSILPPKEGEERLFTKSPLFRTIPADTALVQWRPRSSDVICEVTFLRTEFSWDGMSADSGGRIMGDTEVVKEVLVAMPVSGLVDLQQSIAETLEAIAQAAQEQDETPGNGDPDRSNGR